MKTLLVLTLLLASARASEAPSFTDAEQSEYLRNYLALLEAQIAFKEADRVFKETTTKLAAKCGTDFTIWQDPGYKLSCRAREGKK